MLKIGLDATGGDFAPDHVVAGAVDYLKREKDDVQLYLFGDRESIVGICTGYGADPDNFVIVHCPETITSSDHPVKAIMTKKNSSIAIGYRMLADRRIDAFVGAGSTGAMMTGACTILELAHGLSRPCISVELPHISGRKVLLLDVGFNSDCRPSMLQKFARLGMLYAKSVLGLSYPRVGLLNIGIERQKGNLVAKDTFRLLDGDDSLRFVGNVESDVIFTEDLADVVVTDGFCGNMFLKLAESIYTMAQLRGVADPYFEKFNYELYGGTQVLGVKSVVIIGHGRSTSLAIEKMIGKAEAILRSGYIDKFTIFA